MFLLIFALIFVDLQSKLTDMNVALDSFSSGLTRQHMQNETIAYREKNESIQNQLENLFKERQISEEHNKEMEKEIQLVIRSFLFD